MPAMRRLLLLVPLVLALPASPASADVCAAATVTVNGTQVADTLQCVPYSGPLVCDTTRVGSTPVQVVVTACVPKP